MDPREQKVEVTIYTLRNGVVRVEDAENNLYAAIDLVRSPVKGAGGWWALQGCGQLGAGTHSLLDAACMSCIEMVTCGVVNAHLRLPGVPHHLQVCDKIRAKLQKIKEKAISRGAWPGRAGPKEDVDEEDFQEYLKEVRA